MTDEHYQCILQRQQVLNLGVTVGGGLGPIALPATHRHCEAWLVACVANMRN